MDQVGATNNQILTTNNGFPPASDAILGDKLKTATAVEAHIFFCISLPAQSLETWRAEARTSVRAAFETSSRALPAPSAWLRGIHLITFLWDLLIHDPWA